MRRRVQQNTSSSISTMHSYHHLLLSFSSHHKTDYGSDNTTETRRKKTHQTGDIYLSKGHKLLRGENGKWLYRENERKKEKRMNLWSSFLIKSLTVYPSSSSSSSLPFISLLFSPFLKGHKLTTKPIQREEKKVELPKGWREMMIHRHFSSFLFSDDDQRGKSS